MIYEQCLSCFTRHPEIWISFANYELEVSGILAARAIYHEAIDMIPKSALLRFAYAEIEEKQGNYDQAEQVIRAAFTNIPSGFTFSVLQRYIRRRDGKQAARKLFSDTYVLRQDKNLAFEVRAIAAMRSQVMLTLCCVDLISSCATGARH
jgi:tetratricopeptide (TPR) repeat protein